ncbi:hypothetical protein H6G41_23055 [Tolypothrix sp. FACHB-123]|nr:hypothetical protein [Tolypothrix sp. FACHB-123]MBD2357457.1 hypothetical protein [Tolypothrix sp. FACHB-123]
MQFFIMLRTPCFTITSDANAYALAAKLVKSEKLASAAPLPPEQVSKK